MLATAQRPAAICDAPRVEDYRDVNRANWDDRVAAHAASPDYAVARFAEDPSFLSEVVSFDASAPRRHRGLEAVHLQCHIGTDTVSLARLGARMTGLDFSAPALEQGRRLAAAVGVEVEFVESDLYGAPEALGRSASTSSTRASERSAGCPTSAAGPRSWRASCGRAAGSSCARAIRCCGRWPTRGRTACSWSSARTSSRRSRRSGTRAARTSRPHVFTHNVTHEWNHGLGEIVTALFDGRPAADGARGARLGARGTRSPAR